MPGDGTPGKATKESTMTKLTAIVVTIVLLNALVDAIVSALQTVAQ